MARPAAAPSEAGRGAGSSAFEDYMTKELMPFIDAKYRIAPGRKNRAMAGTFGGRRGYLQYRAEAPGTLQPVRPVQRGPGRRFRHSLPAARGGRESHQRQDRRVLDRLRSAGSVGPAGQGSGCRAHQGANPHTYMDREGGHVWPVWRWALSQFAPLLFKPAARSALP